MATKGNFEDTKAFLKQAQTANGQSLYDHLTDVLLHIVKEKPANALAQFEKISVQLKQQKLQQPLYKEVEPSEKQADPANLKKADTEAKNQLVASCDRTIALAKFQPAEAKQNIEAPDLLAEAEFLEWGGIALGKELVLRLELAISQLAHEKELSNVRFFGKIQGTQQDYYIIEAKLLDAPQDEKADPHMEPYGSGANQYVYFAANSPGGKWTQLPNVLPQQIMLARQMRRFFTGNLAAPVLGFPRFPWGEAAYLRAQIARISAATVLAPKGAFEVDDRDDLVEIQDSEPISPDVNSWVHARPHLLQLGRCTQEEREENEDAPRDPLHEEQPQGRLSAIAGDESKLFPNGSAWSVRSSPQFGGTENPNPRAYVVVRSVAWPGAVTVAKLGQKRVVNFYMGNGHKFLGSPYTPPPPPAIQAEFVPVFNPEQEEDPLLEQTDPLPPKNAKLTDDDAKDGKDNESGDENGDHPDHGDNDGPADD